MAEQAVYGSIYLGDLARDTTWPLNMPGVNQVMVCNVNGPDSYLSVRIGHIQNMAAHRDIETCREQAGPMMDTCVHSKFD